MVDMTVAVAVAVEEAAKHIFVLKKQQFPLTETTAFKLYHLPY